MTTSESAAGHAEDGRQARATAPSSPTPVSSAVLLQGAKSVEISHNGIIYRLQATRLGKLILTK